MDSDLKEAIVRILSDVSKSYYRLIIFAAPQGSGKTKLLKKIAALLGAPVVNLNLELSYRMLTLTKRQRAFRLPELLMEIVEQTKAPLPTNTPAYEFSLLVFDNTELLFDIDLAQDPLRLLLSVARNNTVICSWNGSIVDGRITYASPEHREYRCYKIKDFVAFDLQSPDNTPFIKTYGGKK